MGQEISPFNSPLEIGIRIIILLGEAFPFGLDLQDLINLDYAILHSGDFGGPESLHPPFPQRQTELVVKRDIIRRGILLMERKYIIKQVSTSSGFIYIAMDELGPVLNLLTTDYHEKLKERASWAIKEYNDKSDNTALSKFIKNTWATEFFVDDTFHPIQDR